MKNKNKVVWSARFNNQTVFNERSSFKLRLKHMVVVLFFMLQLVIPFRYLFYPGEFIGLDCISFKAYTHFAVAKEDSNLCIINYHNLESLAARESQLALHISKAVFAVAYAYW